MRRPATPVIQGSPSDLLSIWARRRPDSPCLVDLGAQRTMSFAEVDDRVERVARILVGGGLLPGQRVAILADDGHDFAEVVLACIRTGITFVPLDVRLSDVDLSARLLRSEPKVLFVSERFAPLAVTIAGGVPTIETIQRFGREGYESLVASPPAVDLPDWVDPETTVGLPFTSGTTSAPKAVQQSLRMLTNLATSGIIDYEIGPDEARYTAAPMFHTAGVAFLLMHVSRGITTVVLPRFEGPAVLALLQERLTGCLLSPALLSALVDLPGAADGDYRRLRTIVYGGSPMTPALLARAVECFGCGFVQAFGAGTEAGTQCCLSSDDHRRAVDGEPHLLASVGRPGFGVDLRIVGPDLTDVGAGEVGEIATRSIHLMTGYLGQPDVTAEALETGWFRAGDLARMDDDGYVYLAGRTRDVIVRGGERLYAPEIEDAIAEHPAVVEAAVVGVPDDHWGEAVHAWVTVRRPVSGSELALHTAARLPAARVPTAVHVAESLPRNAAGKVLERVLRAGGAVPSRPADLTTGAG